jgi:hypothetical protein
MPGGTPVSALGSGWNPAASATDDALHQKITVPNVATRLGALCANARIPIVNPSTGPRVPRHLILQVPAAAANPVYVTWDNNTAPVVGGPGAEIVPGGQMAMELAGDACLAQKGGPYYPVAAGSAIQLIATANTPVLANFSE